MGEGTEVIPREFLAGATPQDMIARVESLAKVIFFLSENVNIVSVQARLCGDPVLARASMHLASDLTLALNKFNAMRRPE